MSITEIESDGMSELEDSQHHACDAPFPGRICKGSHSSLVVISGTTAQGFCLNVRAAADIGRG